MGLLDKVKEASKVVTTKASMAATVAKEKTKEAIDDGKAKIAIAQNEGKIKELTAQIGAFMVSKMDEGEQPLCAEIVELYNQIKEKRTTIESLKSEK